MNNLENKGLGIIAKLMAVSARTAPKSGGIDHEYTKIVDNDEKKAIANKMCEIGENIYKINSNKKLGEALRVDWESDARTVDESGRLMLIGVEGKKVLKTPVI